MRERLVWIAAFFLCACSGARPPPPPAHTGWTLLFTQRVGVGPADPRDVRPDVAFSVLDGHAHVTVPDRGLDGRLDGVQRAAQMCRGGQCATVPYADALLALCCNESIPTLAQATEGRLTQDLDVDAVQIANVPTHGGTFRESLRTPSGTVQITVRARWIEQPGDASVEVVKDWFLAPLEHIGAASLAQAIRETSGLPLHWESRLVETHADGSSVEGAVVYHAARLGNPPAAL